MFFLKSKRKSDEILPPPPPFPAMEFDEESNSLPKELEISDEIEKPKKDMAEVLPDEEFKELFKDSGEESKPKKAVRIGKISVKKGLAAKGPKIPKKAIKQAKVALAKKMSIRKIAPIKGIKEKKSIKSKKIIPFKEADLPIKKIKPKRLMKVMSIKSLPIKKMTPIKQIKFPIKKIKEKIPVPQKKIKISKKTIKRAAKPKEIKPKLEEDFGLKDIEFELPKELEKNVELPEKLEYFGIEDVGKEFGIEGLGKELGQESKKPKEILEAEEEIKSAIEKIKEKPSLFNRLFAKRKKEKPEEIHPIPEIADVSVIQSDIKKAREALMKFDLEAAKMNYIEIMKLYSKIKPEEQAKVYHDIKNLYFERKSAEELKV